MSRADRRKVERENKALRKREIKAEKWFVNLNKDQKLLVEEIIRIESQKAINKAGYYLDQVITAAAITAFEDKSLSEINKMFELSSEMLIESEKKEKELKKEYGGMYMSKLKDFEKELILECTKLITNKTRQNDAIKELAFKFPKLTKAQITNCFKKVKEDIAPIIEKKEVIDSVMELTKDVKPAKTTKKEVETKVENKKVESKKIEENKKSKGENEIKNLEDKKMSTLKIRSIKLVVEGNNGMYIAEKGTVKLEKNNWTRAEWEEYKAEVDEVFKMIEAQ